MRAKHFFCLNNNRINLGPIVAKAVVRSKAVIMLICYLLLSPLL